MQKGVFLWSVFFFGWFCFFLLPVFLCFCFVKRPKRLFSCNFRGFLSILFPQKACFKMFIFFLFCFLSLFSFCLPFQNSIFSLLFVHQPLFGKDSLWGFLLSFFFVFSFLNVCFFLWNKLPSIPFLKPKLLLFLACFSSVVFVFVFMVYVSAFLFWCWLCFCYVLFCIFILFLFCFLFCFQTMKQTLFSLQF